MGETIRSNIKNKLFRKILELFAGIDMRAKLPIYNSETFTTYFKKNKVPLQNGDPESLWT